MSARGLTAISTARACFSLFRIKAAEGLQYRLAGFANTATGIFWGLILITVYTVFYRYAVHKEAGLLAGLTLRQVVSYVWLTEVFLPLQPNDIDMEIKSKIVNGDVGIEMCRPLDLYFHWFAKTAAAKLAPLFWRGSITLLVGMILPFSYRLGLPASAAGLLWMLASLAGAFLLCTAFGMFVCAVRLNIPWGDGPTYIMLLVGMVLSGGYLPLQLWPAFLQRFLLLQPFAGYLDIPLRLYLGTMPPGRAAGALGLQLLWTALFIAAGKLLMAKRLRTIVVQGG